jgi:hypothetical protein
LGVWKLFPDLVALQGLDDPRRPKA